MNLVLIALMDSLIMWGAPPLGKVITYGLKLLNLLVLPFLLQHVKGGRYRWALAVSPFLWPVFDESSFISAFQYFFSAILPLITFFILPVNYQKWVVSVFLKIIVFLFSIGLVFYILLNLGIIPPYLTFVRDLDGRTYYNFMFLYYTQGLDPLTLLRFYSVWDEPGVVGTMCSIVLFYYRNTISRKEFIIVLIAGVLSLSLFFLVVLLPVLFFNKFRDYPLGKQFILSFLFLGLVVFVYFGASHLAHKTIDHPTLKFSVYHRFKWSGALITGVQSNRDVMPGFEEAYGRFQESAGKEFWMTGKGKFSAIKEFGSTGLSHRILIYEKGVLFVVYMAIFYFMMHRWSRKNFIFNLVSLGLLTLLFMQRPLLYGLYFVMLIYVGLSVRTLAEDKLES